MKKVIIIAYAFPPVGGVGVHRVTKHVKYLKNFGWEPVVLTVANPSVPIVDEALLQDIPDGVIVFRARSFEPSYAQKKNFAELRNGWSAQLKLFAKNVLSGLLLPDIQVLWWPGLIWRLISMVKNERPNCIFVTAPPFSAFIPVVAIGAFFKVPVVADFRDEWSFSRAHWENSAKGKIAKTLDVFFEKYVVSKSTAITAATQSYINTLDRNYQLPSGKGTVITNGFDEDDFVFDQHLRKICNNKISIVYSGTVWNGSSLKCFASALHELLDTDPVLQQAFQIKLFGRVVDTELSYLKSSDLEEVIQLFGYIDHSDIIREMCEADILLLVISDLPGAEKIIVAKTFEYMATGKHIFAMVPEGETKTLLSEQYGNVTFANPGDASDIKEKFLSMIQSFDEIKTVVGKDVMQYSRRSLTGQLVDVFNRVTSS